MKLKFFSQRVLTKRVLEKETLAQVEHTAHVSLKNRIQNFNSIQFFATQSQVFGDIDCPSWPPFVGGGVHPKPRGIHSGSSEGQADFHSYCFSAMLKSMSYSLPLKRSSPKRQRRNSPLLRRCFQLQTVTMTASP